MYICAGELSYGWILQVAVGEWGDGLSEKGQRGHSGCHRQCSPGTAGHSGPPMGEPLPWLISQYNGKYRFRCSMFIMQWAIFMGIEHERYIAICTFSTIKLRAFISLQDSYGDNISPHSAASSGGSDTTNKLEICPSKCRYKHRHDAACLIHIKIPQYFDYCSVATM